VKKPCLRCGSLFTPTAGLRARCRECQRADYRDREARRPAIQKATYASRAWQELARAVVAAAVECTWCHTPASRTKLTADHVVPVKDAPGLALEPGNVVAACRSCQEKRKRRPNVATWEAWERRP
jgi:5-methylcytosine-specific restriction endonuclease McrA